MTATATPPMDKCSSGSFFYFFIHIPPNPANKIADFTSANLPLAQGAFVDGIVAGTLTPKQNYYYKMIALGSGSIASPASAAATDDASPRCPDLIVQSITLPHSEGYPAGTVLSGSGPHSFSAVIKNQGEGTDPTKTFFNRISVNGITVLADRPNPEDQPISGGLGANLTRSITSGSWTADTVTSATTKTVKVCADQPPPKPGVITEAPPTGIPSVGDNPAEENNCSTANANITNGTITIIPLPITVQLEVEKAGTNAYRSDYVIVDYKDLANLRWKVTGSPTKCEASHGTDLSGPVVKESYTTSGNPFSLTNLLNKLSFKYKIECSR